MKRNSLLAGIALLLIASSCGGKGDSGGTAAPEAARGVDIIRMSETGATFVGKCQPMTLLDQKVYVESRYTFAKVNSRAVGIPPYSEQIEIYRDSKCHDHLQTTVASGDYGFSANGGSAQITFTGMLIIPQDEKFVRILNEKVYCGLNDWVAGSGRDVSREGNCWESARSASYLIEVEEGETKKAEVYNCPNNLASVPSSECVRLKMVKAE